MQLRLPLHGRSMRGGRGVLTRAGSRRAALLPLPQEWQVVSIAGRSKAAARAGGHVIAVHEGTPFMYGGRDALGAQVSHLLRLRRVGPNRWLRLLLLLAPLMAACTADAGCK
jgi:hypothetical protein